ncbi:MAG TPA: phosphodiester glycosidase family protein, partial [Burkholderiaceae bacterium]
SVNASYFTKVFAVRGITISDGQAWAPVTSIAQSPLLACEAGPRCVIELHPTEPKPEWQMAVAGTPWLLDQGKQRTLEDDVACKAHCTTTHPRTAVGLTRDGRMLLIVLAEGRRPPVLGLTTQQLSKVMADLGAWDAVNLDGGGSSTLIVDGASLMGRPFNEPKLRAVANAINLVPR